MKSPPQNKLTDKIIQKYRKVYSPEVLKRWNTPGRYGPLPSPDGYALTHGDCGDEIEFFIRMENNRILECSFVTNACAVTLACCSAAAELAEQEIFPAVLERITAESIVALLGGLPDRDVHCAELAAVAVRRALADALYQKRTPWKKAYRKS